MQNSILEYFKTFYKGDLTVKTDLFAVGALDSIGIVALITFLEANHGVAIDPADINEDNFKTIEAISKLVNI
jgi:acyl carrier protein